MLGTYRVVDLSNLFVFKARATSPGLPKGCFSAVWGKPSRRPWEESGARVPFLVHPNKIGPQCDRSTASIIPER